MVQLLNLIMGLDRDDVKVGTDTKIPAPVARQIVKVGSDFKSLASAYSATSATSFGMIN
jgi:hypothetical protein